MQLRYRDGPLVLKGLDFQINPREKIGIAGRTGSGKSSLMSALFRMTELAGGKLMIDGVNISTIGLRELRSNLCIIPQDPTVRSEEHTSELQSLMRISYAVFCLKTKNTQK